MKITKSLVALFLLSIMAASCGERSSKLEVLDLGGEFEMTDHNGADFKFSSLKGNTVLVFFGYTSCPDACPAMLAKISTVYRKLGSDAENLKTLLISVDPERDTPAKLKEYLSYFKYNPIGLTGTKEQVDHVTKLYKIFYAKRISSSKIGYEMDHSTSVFVFDEQGQARYIFSAGDRPENLVSIIKFLQK